MVVNYAQRPFRSRRSIWERPVHLRLRVLLAEPSELDPLGLTLSAAIPGLLAGTIHIEPRSSVCSLAPSSRATVASGGPVLIASFCPQNPPAKKFEAGYPMPLFRMVAP